MLIFLGAAKGKTYDRDITFRVAVNKRGNVTPQI